MSWGEVSSSPSHVSMAAPTSNFAYDPAATTKSSESTGQTISTSRLHYEPLRGHSSAGRASVWQTEGRRFEPGWLHSHAYERPRRVRAAADAAGGRTSDGRRCGDRGAAIAKRASGKRRQRGP